MEITSWNQCAERFIDPPKFTWTPVEGCTEYLVQFAWGAAHPTSIVTRAPEFDFSPYWAEIPIESVDWVVTAKDATHDIDQMTPRRFAKAPDFDGREEPAEDWEASALSYAEWLLDAPEVEQGGPRYLYSSGISVYDKKPNRIVYPALHHSSLIFFFSEVARRFGEREVGQKARAAALAIGEWMLAHTLDEGFRCSRFPLSSWIPDANSPRKSVEGNLITLFRTGRAGVAMLTLYRAHGDQRFLDYAMHLAQIMAQFQQDDGGWPYRIDPETGEVAQAYTSAAICFVKFFETLQEVTGSSEYQRAIDASVRWTLENPVQTNLWQGMYEDVGEKPPFHKLQNQDAFEVVRFLCRHRGTYPDAISMAQRVLRFCEDQFAVFGPYRNNIPGQAVYPTVIEQYGFPWPMPGHTGNYLRSLMALHQATGDGVFYTKALRAANAITRLQHEDGRYSTHGIDYRFGKPLQPRKSDWFGNGARAAYALLRWSEYVAANVR